MEIKTLVLSQMNTNVYLLVFEHDIIVIDPADDAQTILSEAEKLSKHIRATLITHGHFDHCNAALSLQKCGVPVYMSETDFNMIENGLDLARYCGTHFNKFVPDVFLTEGETVLAGHEVRVIATPGHTAGGLTYVFGDKIFCGDTLFYLGIGRSDLPTGDKLELTRSVKRLYELGSGEVYPGHGAMTTIQFEKTNNPYVKT